MTTPAAVGLVGDREHRASVTAKPFCSREGFGVNSTGSKSNPVTYSHAVSRNYPLSAWGLLRSMK